MDELGLKLFRDRAVLLVIDVQERLAAAMPEGEMARTSRNVVALIKGAGEVLGVPVLATEQYPRGIGPTISPVRTALPEAARPIEKLSFSCLGAQPVQERLQATGRKQVIACGMEAHVCVFQTVRDLVQRGYQVFVPQDAVISRTGDNLRVGLSLIERAGGVITSTETVLFDLLDRAGTPEFKAISALIK